MICIAYTCVLKKVTILHLVIENYDIQNSKYAKIKCFNR